MGSFSDTAPEIYSNLITCEVSNIAADEKVWLVFGIDPYIPPLESCCVLQFLSYDLLKPKFGTDSTKIIRLHELLVTVLNSLQGEYLYLQGRLNYHVYYGYLLFSIDILKKFILPYKINKKLFTKTTWVEGR